MNPNGTSSNMPHKHPFPTHISTTRTLNSYFLHTSPAAPRMQDYRKKILPRLIFQKMHASFSQRNLLKITSQKNVWEFLPGVPARNVGGSPLLKNEILRPGGIQIRKSFQIQNEHQRQANPTLYSLSTFNYIWVSSNKNRPVLFSDGKSSTKHQLHQI